MDRTHKSTSFWILVLTLTFLFGVVLDSFSGFQRECRELYGDVLRLHILANSDSAEDQAVKLLVRDAILAPSRLPAGIWIRPFGLRKRCSGRRASPIPQKPL